MLKSLVAAVITAAMLFSNVPTKVPDYSGTLVALGDSITYGYGLSDRETQCHAAILADMYGLTLDNMAVNGNRASDVIPQIRLNAYSERLARADLICMSIGGNELLGPLLDTLYEVIAQKGYSSNISSLTAAQFVAIAYAFLADDSVKDSLDQKIESNLASFELYFPLLIAQIRAIDPDADILVQTLYNPLDGTDNFLFQQLADRYSYAFDRINEIITETDDIKIADVASVFEGRSGELTNINTFDVHPNAAGHELIAQIEYEALKYKDYTLAGLASMGAFSAIFSAFASMFAVDILR